MIGTASERLLPISAPGAAKSSADIIDAILQAQREMRSFDENARQVDLVYSGRAGLVVSIDNLGLSDDEYETFWAAMEVLKPAIYAKPPQVVAKPRYSDATPAQKVAAEVIERVINSEFERGNVDLALREVRDDLALSNRGVLWTTYESDDGKRICVDHIDRRDFMHEPSRYWSEVGWVARRAWLTEDEMKERFEPHSGDAYKSAGYESARRDFDDGAQDDSQKAAVWEVWSKTLNRVFWVSEGVDVMLDEGAPHMDLRDFFPCPRPAYGTLKRRTLVPIPDYVRYQSVLGQINLVTARIYTLLDRIRLVGLLPAGGDIGDALETAMSENVDAMFIPVPSAAMTGTGDYIQWVPLDMVATTIQGLIEARTQLFADFDRLSGISDIMRGETEANETLGAQRIKTQYGSIRVKDKTDEIVRVSRDAARIATELVCVRFDQDTLLDIAQMEIPTSADVKRDIDALTKAAKEELEALDKKAKEAAEQARQSGQQIDPAQAQQMLTQAQAQIAEKYRPQFEQLQNTVVVEDVMELIKDRRERGLVIDIETDSTVMVDEMAEKQARNELLTAFSSAISALLPLFQIGEPGVKLAVTMLGFTLQPYTRGNRQIQAQLDELIEQAPEIAQKMAAQNDKGDDQGLAEANNKLAEAETIKAKAAMAGVEAKSALDKAEMQRKLMQMQQDAQAQQQKSQADMAKLQLQLQKQTDDAAEQQAKIDNLTAKTAEILHSIGLNERKQQLSEYQAAEQSQTTQVDQAMQAEGMQQDAEFRGAELQRAERGEDRADRQQDFSEQSGDRQMTLAEQQAQQETPDGNR
jgi:hypothetical protein